MLAMWNNIKFGKAFLAIVRDRDCKFLLDLPLEEMCEIAPVKFSE